MARVKITQDVFDSVKLLASNGVKYDKISRTFGIAKSTISLLNGCETIDDYKQYIHEKNTTKAEPAKAEPAKSEEPPVQKTQVFIPYHVIEKLDKANEYLKAISNKLAFIVDELCGVKTNAEQDH